LPSTTIFGLRYPATTNAPNIPGDLQNLANDIDAALARRAPKPGTDNAFLGTVWDGVTPLLEQWDTVVVNTSSGGNWSIGFPVAYAHGLLVAVACAADVASSLGFVLPTVGGSSLSHLGGVAFQPGGSVVGTGLPVRINYHVLGW
jgi:hypothetical protein